MESTGAFLLKSVTARTIKGKYREADETTGGQTNGVWRGERQGGVGKCSRTIVSQREVGGKEGYSLGVGTEEAS